MFPELLFSWYISLVQVYYFVTIVLFILLCLNSYRRKLYVKQIKSLKIIVIVIKQTEVETSSVQRIT
jgi:hypothetical protein